MNVADLAGPAAALWGGVPLRLIRNRENAVFEVALPQGRGALRLHRSGYQDEVAIRSELWWCGALAERGVPVATPLPSLKGEVLHRLDGGRLCSMIGWIEGDPIGEAGVPLAAPPDLQARRHHALGALVARMHGATAGLALPPWFRRPAWDVAGLVGETPFWGRFWDHPAATPAQRAVLGAARTFLQAELSRHAAGQPVQPVHADVLRENVLVNDRSLWLIDFDDSGFGFPLYDLGTCLSQNLYEPYYADLRDALMDGYGTADRAMVDTMTLARTCASVGWTMPRLPPGDPVVARHIARAVMWAERVMAPG